MKKVCILLHQIGPYHHARFNALAKLFNVLVVEIRATSTEYYWTNLNHGVCNYTVLRAQGKEAIASVYNQNTIDFFLTYGWNEQEYLQTILYAKKNNKKVFMASDSIEIGSPRNFIKHYIKRKIAKSIDGFLVAGTRSEAYIRYYAPQALIIKPFDVVDNSHFANTGLYQGEGYVLCVARLIKKKNIDSLIDAVSMIKNEFIQRKLKLKIVGLGDEESYLRSLILKHQLEGIVELISWKSYNELPNLYYGAQVLVLPSIHDETWGLVVNESMAAGLPVLLSNKCGCADDLVEDGVNGLIFSPSSKSISEALLSFLSMPIEKKRKFGEESLVRISNYSLENHVLAVGEIYERSLFCKMSYIELLLLRFIYILVS